MDRFNLENEFKGLKEGKAAADMPISPLVRARLDETYASLPEQPAGRRSKPLSRLRRLSSATAAAFVLGAGVFASGFVSPVMADSIKSIPLIGSLFSSIEGDIGLRNAGDLGLASSVNSGVSYKDVKLEVTETVFDGSRAAFLVKVAAPNLENGRFDTGKKTVKLSDAISNVTVSVDGKQQGDSGSILQGGYYAGAGEAHPDMLIFEEVLEPSGSSTVPDTFTAEAVLTLEGIDHEFKLDIPFTKTTQDIVNVQPDAVSANDELSVSVASLQSTPLTTRVHYSIALTNADKLTEKQEKQLNKIRVAVYDDQGRQLPALNGDGEYSSNALTFDARYASTSGTTSYLLLKPFIVEDDFTETVKEKQFIKGMELKIELPAAK
ncbi:hypothetical protein C2I18_26405 [Paenibacillus sp. PK3_47]|uniref:DUF4179 domain-containing protein n=1 Tax=Paenibacillus sp. PK3_47 TaxID=2072642 RepID=UPI00201E1CBD|nr:DUF4179 domain-containing protein [Paenibacillus sp. PK3_47]UQZ36753.1 hypothetical protein C2I18_26405 [Paenibacillus sp. PK3_47]